MTLYVAINNTNTASNTLDLHYGTETLASGQIRNPQHLSNLSITSPFTRHGLEQLFSLDFTPTELKIAFCKTVNNNGPTYISSINVADTNYPYYNTSGGGSWVDFDDNHEKSNAIITLNPANHNFPWIFDVNFDP